MLVGRSHSQSNDLINSIMSAILFLVHHKKKKEVGVNWTRAFLSCVRHDLVLIVGMVRVGITRAKANYVQFRNRKLYEEPSLLFRFLYSPIRVFRRLKDIIAAKKMGVTLERYNEIEIARLNSETELLKQKTQQIRSENLQSFAKNFPGATLDQYTYFTEKPRYLTFRYIINSVFR